MRSPLFVSAKRLEAKRQKKRDVAEKERERERERER